MLIHICVDIYSGIDKSVEVVGHGWCWFLYCHHHHIALVARISLTLSRHSSLSFIALGRSSGQHPVSSHSCWMYVRAGRPAFARPCVGVHKSTFLMSSSLLLQQCPAYLARLTWIVFVIEGRWSYSWCLVGCCRQDLFKIESTEKDIETRLAKAWTAINRLSIIWKSDLTDKMKRSFFQAAVTSILLYGCTTWTLTKRLEKKLDGNYIRMLRAIYTVLWGILTGFMRHDWKTGLVLRGVPARM